jgi:hypothetical protein
MLASEWAAQQPLAADGGGCDPEPLRLNGALGVEE